MTYQELIDLIDNTIYDNTSKDVSGQDVNDVLKAIIDYFEENNIIELDGNFIQSTNEGIGFKASENGTELHAELSPDNLFIGSDDQSGDDWKLRLNPEEGLIISDYAGNINDSASYGRFQWILNGNTLRIEARNDGQFVIGQIGSLDLVKLSEDGLKIFSEDEAGLDLNMYGLTFKSPAHDKNFCTYGSNYISFPNPVAQNYATRLEWEDPEENETIIIPNRSGEMAIASQANGNFTTTDGKTIVVEDGIITDIIN